MSDDDAIPWAQRRHCDLSWPWKDAELLRPSFTREDGCTAIMYDHGWKAGVWICPQDLPQYESQL